MKICRYPYFCLITEKLELYVKFPFCYKTLYIHAKFITYVAIKKAFSVGGLNFNKITCFQNGLFFGFLAPLAVGQRAYVMARCPSVRALTFSLNIFFTETTYRILMKFHRNVPTMVLFRISWNNLIPSKTLVAMATKLNFFWNLWKSSCQKP